MLNFYHLLQFQIQCESFGEHESSFHGKAKESPQTRAKYVRCCNFKSCFQTKSLRCARFGTKMADIMLGTLGRHLALEIKKVRNVGGHSTPNIKRHIIQGCQPIATKTCPIFGEKCPKWRCFCIWSSEKMPEPQKWGLFYILLHFLAKKYAPCLKKCQIF